MRPSKEGSAATLREELLVTRQPNTFLLDFLLYQLKSPGSMLSSPILLMGWYAIKQTNTCAGGGLGYFEKGRGFLILPSALCTRSQEHPCEDEMDPLEQRLSLLGVWRRELMHSKGSQATKEFLQIHDSMALFSISFKYADHGQCYHFLFYAKKSKIKIIL